MRIQKYKMFESVDKCPYILDYFLDIMDSYDVKFFCNKYKNLDNKYIVLIIPSKLRSRFTSKILQDLSKVHDTMNSSDRFRFDSFTIYKNDPTTYASSCLTYMDFSKMQEVMDNCKYILGIHIFIEDMDA